MDPAAYIQEHFRIRSDDTQGLNIDAGWAAALDIDATIDAGQRFRVRFEVEETAAEGASNTFKIQYNLNSAGWNDIICAGNSTDTDSAVIGVRSEQFNHLDATTDILSGSSASFVAGDGVCPIGDPLLPVTGGINIDAEHTEIEFCLVINGLWTENSQLSDSDTIELRCIEGDGTVFVGAYTNPTITVNIPTGYIGGTYVETPKELIKKDSNGNLYFVCEATPGANTPHMMKSTDDGVSWLLIDGANNPTETDLEGFDVFQVGDTLHLAHYSGNDIWYHIFRTSDHASADTWGTKDTAVWAGTGTEVQQIKVVVRSDGDVIVFYNRINGGDTSLYYVIDTGGGFGSELTLDAEATVDMFGLAVVMGASDKTHIFYRADNIIYHRSLDSGDTLSGRESCETIGSPTLSEDPFAGAVYWDDGGTEKVMAVYIDDGGDDLLHSCVVTSDGSPETPKIVTDNTCMHNGLDAQQVSATMSISGNIAHVMYTRISDKDFYHTSSENDGTWSSDVIKKSGIDGSWVRSVIYNHDSADYFGYVWDEGAEYTSNSSDATGYIRYDEFILQVSTDLPLLPSYFIDTRIRM